MKKFRKVIYTFIWIVSICSFFKSLNASNKELKNKWLQNTVEENADIETLTKFFSVYKPVANFKGNAQPYSYFNHGQQEQQTMYQLKLSFLGIHVKTSTLDFFSIPLTPADNKDLQRMKSKFYIAKPETSLDPHINSAIIREAMDQMKLQVLTQCIQLEFTLFSNQTQRNWNTTRSMLHYQPEGMVPTCTEENSKLITMTTPFYFLSVNEAFHTTSFRGFIPVEMQGGRCSKLEGFLKAIFDTHLLDPARNLILKRILEGYDSSNHQTTLNLRSQSYYGAALLYDIYRHFPGDSSQLTKEMLTKFQWNPIHLFSEELNFFQEYLKTNHLISIRALVVPLANEPLLTMLNTNEYLKLNRIPIFQSQPDFDAFTANHDIPAVVSKTVFKEKEGLQLFHFLFWKLEFKFAFDVVDLKESKYKYLRVIETFQYLEDTTFSGIILPLSFKMRKFSIGLIQLNQKQPLNQVPFQGSFLKALTKAPFQHLEVYLPSFDAHAGFFMSLHLMLDLSLNQFKSLNLFRTLENNFVFNHLFHICVDQTGDIPMTMPLGKSIRRKVFKLDSEFYFAIIDNATGSILMYTPMDRRAFLPKGHKGCNEFKWENN